MMLRGGRRAQQEEEEGEGEEVSNTNQITYVITARGSYRPPPHRQLGSAVAYSINSHPQDLTKSLKDKEALPEALLRGVKDVKATWLTVKETPVLPPSVIIDEAGFIDSWIFILVVTLAGLAALVMGAFAYRRLEHRRCRVSEAAVMTDLEAECEVRCMPDGDIKKELRSYGISTLKFRDKTELVDALVKARMEGKTPVKKKVTFSITSLVSSFSSTSADAAASLREAAEAMRENAEASMGEVDRLEEIEEAKKSCESLRTSELKQMLKALGVSLSGFREKSELVRALAEARVNGTKGKVPPLPAKLATATVPDPSIKKPSPDKEKTGGSRPREQVRSKSPSPGRAGGGRGGGGGGVNGGSGKQRRRRSIDQQPPSGVGGAGVMRSKSHSPSGGRSKSHSPSGGTRKAAAGGEDHGVRGPHRGSGPSRRPSIDPDYKISDYKRSSSDSHGGPRQQSRRSSYNHARSRNESPANSRRRSQSPAHHQSFLRSWSEGGSHKRFDPSGFARPTGNQSEKGNSARKSRRSRSQDSVRKELARSQTSTRSRSAEASRPSPDKVRSPRPRSRSRSRSKCPSAQPENTTQDKIDDLFNDTYSFDIGSIAPPDPPETERPPSNNRHASVRADLKAAEPWMS